jgi:hypothetical protein
MTTIAAPAVRPTTAASRVEPREDLPTAGRSNEVADVAAAAQRAAVDPAMQGETRRASRLRDAIAQQRFLTMRIDAAELPPSRLRPIRAE